MKCVICGKDTPNNIPNCVYCGYKITENGFEKQNLCKTNFSLQSAGVNGCASTGEKTNKKAVIALSVTLSAVFLIILIVLICLLSGGNKSYVPVAAGNGMTRAEWIVMLADSYSMEDCAQKEPYFDDINISSDCFKAVQYCTEWDILDKSDGQFHPNDGCTNRFAMITAVKSIGLDLINASISGRSVSDDDDIITYFKKQTGLNIEENLVLDRETAKQIISSIKTIIDNLTFNNSVELELKDNVKEIKADNVIKDTGKTLNLINSNFKAGDIMFIEACEKYPSGKAVKVTGADGNTANYEEAKLDEVLDDVDIVGDFIPQLLEPTIDSDDYGVSIINNPEEMKFDDNKEIVVTRLGTSSQPEIKNASVNIDKKQNVGDMWIRLESKVNQNVEVNGKLCLADLSVKFQFKYDHGIKKVYAAVSTTIKMQVSLTVKKNMDIPAIKCPFTLFGCVGGEIDININVGISGSANAKISCDFETGFSYKKGAFPKLSKSVDNPDADVNCTAKGYVKPKVVLFAVLLGKDLFDVGFETGFEADGKNNDYGCIDINLYWIFEAFINSEKSLLSEFDVTASWTIFDKDNSPLKWKWHIENGEIVDKCTKKGSISTKKNYKEALKDLLYNFPNYGFDPEDDYAGIELIDLNNDKIPEVLYCSYSGTAYQYAWLNGIFEYNGKKYVERKIQSEVSQLPFPINPMIDSSDSLEFHNCDIFISDDELEIDDLSDLTYRSTYGNGHILKYDFEKKVLKVNIMLDCSDLFNKMYNHEFDKEAAENSWDEYKSKMISYNNEYHLDSNYKYTVVPHMPTADILSAKNLSDNERLRLYHNVMTEDNAEYIIKQYDNNNSYTDIFSHYDD